MKEQSSPPPPVPSSGDAFYEVILFSTVYVSGIRPLYCPGLTLRVSVVSTPLRIESDPDLNAGYVCPPFRRSAQLTEPCHHRTRDSSGRLPLSW